VLGSHTPRANALGVYYAKHLVKNLFTTVAHHVISIFSETNVNVWDVRSKWKVKRNRGTMRKKIPNHCLEKLHFQLNEQFMCTARISVNCLELFVLG